MPQRGVVLGSAVATVLVGALLPVVTNVATAGPLPSWLAWLQVGRWPWWTLVGLTALLVLLVVLERRSSAAAANAITTEYPPGLAMRESPGSTQVLLSRMHAGGSVEVTLNQWAAAGTADGRRLRSMRVVSSQIIGFADVVGRDRELLALETAFSDSPEPVIRILTGLGGIGKTSVARAYTARHKERYGLVWWVSADNADAAIAQFRALLEILAPQDAAQINYPVQGVHAILANRLEPWLLILDNVQDHQALQGLLPAAGRGHVIVTSQATTWPNGRRVVEIGPPMPLDAIDILTGLTEDTDRAAATELAEELGFLPLALAQARSYMAQNPSVRIVDYLRLFRERSSQMLHEGQAPDYDNTVATTWQLAFNRLTPAARALLNIVCWYAPQGIPVRHLLDFKVDVASLPEPATTLLRPLVNDEIERLRAIANLSAYGLISTSADTSITVHRLVQIVTANKLATTAPAWIDAAATLLHAAVPERFADKPNTAAWLVLEQHVRTLLTHLLPEDVAALAIRGDLAYWTELIGDARHADYLYNALLTDRQRVLGPYHPDTLDARRHLAGWIGANRDAKQAFDILVSLEADCLRVLGPDHSHTLKTRHDIAMWIGRNGNAKKACNLFVALQADCLRVLGPDNRDTLDARRHIADWAYRAGDAKRAGDLYAALLTDYLRVLGPDDPHTLKTRHSLVISSIEARGAEHIRDMYATLLSDHLRVLGPDHLDTLDARFHVANWTGKAGDAKQARDLLAALVIDGERISGTDHIGALDTRLQFAIWTGMAGDAKHARYLLDDLLPNYQRILGPDHPVTLSTRHELAIWTGRAGDSEHARELLANLLPDYVRVLGSNHTDTFKLRYNLVLWTGWTGDTEQARALNIELVQDMRHALGAHHPETRRAGMTLPAWTIPTWLIRIVLFLARFIFRLAPHSFLRFATWVTKYSIDKQAAEVKTESE